MNKLATVILSSAVFAMSTTSAFSQEDNKPNYNYIGLGYVYNRLDTSSDEGTDGNAFLNDAYAVDASYALFDRVLFHGSFYDGEGDLNSDTEISLKSTEIGISALNVDDDNVGIDGGILWRKDDLGSDADGDLKGFGLGFGVRANVAEKHELGARVGIYFGDFDDSVGVKLFYAWNLAEHWAITAGYEYMDVSLNDSDDPNIPRNDGSGMSDPFDYTNNKFTFGGRFSF
jgi:hypothetical protein